MSQTWVIKDTAPDISTLHLAPENGDDEYIVYSASFESNGEVFSSLKFRYKRFSTTHTLRLYYNDTLVTNVLRYNIEGSYTGLPFVFENEAYRTLKFDIAPTGELLAWLQKNAILKMPGIKYQDIHLEDKALWNQLQTAWEQGDYTTALNVLKNASLSDKQLNAAAINAMTTELLSLQAQSDPSFKTGTIVVASEPPSDLAVGKVYFRLIGPVTDYNEQNAYYIEINQKTSSGYDVLNPATQADNVALTENTAAKFGLVGVTYTLDKALYDVEQLLQVVTTT